MGPNESTRRDEELLEALAHGDDASFQILYLRHRSSLYAYFLRRTRAPQASEDLVSCTFLALYERRHSFRNIGFPGAGWIWGIARRELGTHYKSLLKEARLHVRVRPLDEGEDDQAYEDLLKKLDAPRQRAALIDAFECLSPTEREAVHLTVVERLSYQEAAGIMNCSTGAARVRAHRGLARLRMKLATSKWSLMPRCMVMGETVAAVELLHLTETLLPS